MIKGKRIISLTVVLVILASMFIGIMPTVEAYADTDIPSDLVLQYKFDSASLGEDVVKDISGNNYHGKMESDAVTTVEGITLKLPTIVNIDGREGVALDGVSQYVCMPKGIMHTLDDFTISFWTYLDAKQGQYTRFFDFGNDLNGKMYFTEEMFLSMDGTIAGKNTMSGGNPIETGKWAHIAVTKIGNQYKLFKDGVEVENATMDVAPSTYEENAYVYNYIGKSNWPDPYLKGKISDFRIYSKGLTDEEVGQLAEIDTILCPKVTIDFNDEKQEIDGFGASNAWITGDVRNRLPSEKEQKEILDALFSTTDGAGLSIVRNRIPFDMMSESGEWNWNHWDTGDTAWFFNKIKDEYNVTNFFSTPWTPPSFMKIGHRGDYGEIGGKLDSTKYQEYAEYLADYVTGFKENWGIDISAVSLQNEPNWFPEYESCEWSAEEFHTFVKENLKPTFDEKDITAKVIMPEGLDFSEALAIPTLDDVDTRNRVDIVGVHQYGVDSKDPNLGAKWLSNTKKYNKKLWVTEASTGDPNDKTISDGIYWAKMIHKDLTVAEVNAFCYWWLWNTTKDSENPVGDKGALITFHTNDNDEIISYDLNKRLYTLGQYSRFIRPGYKRVNSDVEPATGIYTTAYKDSSSGELVIIAINDNENEKTLTFDINDIVIGSYTTYRTSDEENITNLGNTVVNETTFNVSLKGKSVTTFHADVIDTDSTTELVTGVMLNKSNSLITIGDTDTLLATVVPSNATNKVITWSSSNPTVATVDNLGVVTAKAAGEATITVTTVDGGFIATCDVTVESGEISGVDVTGVTLSKNTATIRVDKTTQLIATITPENATNKAVKWSSSDETVATVDQTGKVTGIKAGTAIITVRTTDGNFTAECVMTITKQSSSGGGSGGSSSGGGSSTTTPHRPKEPVKKPEELQIEEPKEKITVPSTLVFRDVKNHWASQDIQKLVEKNVIGGYPDGTFRPSQPITRAEFITLICRLLNLESINGESAFRDVKTNAWYAGGVNAANKAGIVSGYEDGTFKPEQRITREEAFVILYRMAKEKLNALEDSNNFADDGSISSWAKEAVNALVGLGAVGGYEDGTIKPKDNITRAETAKILSYFLQ